MVNQDPALAKMLANLHDIVVPPAVGWWPPSSALVGLMVGISGILIGLLWYYLKQRRQNHYRRQAKNLFDQTMIQAQTPQEKLLQASKLLKQVAITNYGRQRVASLNGKAWIQFLKGTALYIDQPPHLQSHFEAIYQPFAKLDDQEISETLNYVQSWIKGHHK